MNREGAPKALTKDSMRGHDDVLGHFSLSDLENYKKATEGSVETARHVLEGIDKEKDGTTYDYYERHLASETEELARINKEIIKRKI